MKGGKVILNLFCSYLFTNDKLFLLQSESGILSFLGTTNSGSGFLVILDFSASLNFCSARVFFFGGSTGQLPESPSWVLCHSWHVIPFFFFGARSFFSEGARAFPILGFLCHCLGSFNFSARDPGDLFSEHGLLGFLCDP
jgi:hypothetical protein